MYVMQWMVTVEYKKGDDIMKWDYYPEEIAQVLCEDTYDDCNGDDPRYKEAVEGLEWLKTAAENPYNARYFKALYTLLEDYTGAHEGYLK